MTTPRKDATRGECPSNVDTVDEAIAETIHRTPGHHPKAIADAIGKSHRYVLDIADELRDARLKVNELVPVVRATGNTLIVDVIERQLGRVAYDLPTVDADDTDVMKRCAAVMKETADVIAELAKAPKGGAWSKRDVCRLEREGEEAVRAILSAVAHARARAW